MTQSKENKNKLVLKYLRTSIARVEISGFSVNSQHVGGVVVVGYSAHLHRVVDIGISGYPIRFYD